MANERPRICRGFPPFTCSVFQPYHVESIFSSSFIRFASVCARTTTFELNFVSYIMRVYNRTDLFDWVSNPRFLALPAKTGGLTSLQVAWSNGILFWISMEGVRRVSMRVVLHAPRSATSGGASTPVFVRSYPRLLAVILSDHWTDNLLQS
jgi:hypothetical protein